MSTVASSLAVATSAALLDRSRRSLAMGVSSGMRRAGAPQPLFFERGEGPYFFDAHGRAVRHAIERAAARRGIPLVTSGSGPVFSVHFGLTEPPRRRPASGPRPRPADRRPRGLFLASGHGIG